LLPIGVRSGLEARITKTINLHIWDAPQFNSLMGKEIAPVENYEPTTMVVKNYGSHINGVDEYTLL
jgi:hypothetical protein